MIGVYPQPQPRRGRRAADLYLHEVGDPGNVGAIVRTADALRWRRDRPRPRLRGSRTGRRPCARAWARSSAMPISNGGQTPLGCSAPWSGSSPTAGRRPTTSPVGALMLGRRARGPARRARRALRPALDDPAARRGRVAERRGRGGGRAGTDIVGGRLMLERIDSLRAEASAAIAAAARHRRRSRSCGSATSGRNSELTAILRGIADLEPAERGAGRLRRQRGAQGARGRARGARGRARGGRARELAGGRARST